MVARLARVGPGARRRCERVIIPTGEVSSETRYAVTSLPTQQADAAGLERYWRGHWCIENRVHHVRDVTMGENAGDVYVGQAPQVMAALRNALLNLLRHRGWISIADALRHYGACPGNALAFIGAIPAGL